MSDDIHIEPLRCLDERSIQGLCDVLMDCVEGGASVSFMWPMTQAKAETFWRASVQSAARGERVILVARDRTNAIVGTVTLITNLPENQPHRGDIAKMLVHRRARK